MRGHGKPDTAGVDERGHPDGAGDGTAADTEHSECAEPADAGLVRARSDGQPDDHGRDPGT
ncbi:hypothetical protein CA983_05095 [Streptomyces swartbergensis]|uniref:Uncharacterized protein n=1 Tax=Streptomyces swartbergensis TaxID=487165 RepID=A0A243S9E2_9ACTN|nr:hypothetical protein CA983_05095 [Streptomyces swartbergensis]